MAAAAFNDFERLFTFLEDATASYSPSRRVARSISATY
jgi:hypothetical protein